MGRMKYACAAGLALLIAVSVNLFAQLENPGFEDVYQPDPKTGYEKNMEDNKWDFEKPLVFPMGWRLNISLTKGGKYRLFTDKSAAFNGNNCVYVKGHLMHEKTIDVTAGDELEVSFYVKDPEKKKAGATLYLYGKDEKGKIKSFLGSLLFTVQAEAEWTKQSGMIKIPEESRGERINAIIVAVFSDTGAYFDNVELTHKRTTRWLNYQDAMIEGSKKAVSGKYPGARDDFNAGLALTENRKERIDAFLKISETYISEKNYLKAVDTFNTILLKENPDLSLKVELHMKIADAYINAKEYISARETLGNILKMGKEADGVKVDAQLKIADTWLKEKKYLQAIEALGEVMKMEQAGDIVMVAAQFRIGDAYASSRDNDKARESYLKVLSMKGTTFVDKFDANKKIGDLYRNEKNHDKAREFYDRALNVEDVNPWSESSLLSIVADTYVTEARFEEARKYYRRILDIGLDAWSHMKPAYIKIGETYRKEGNYVREREIYDEMLKWAEDNIYRINIDISGEMALAYADWNRLTGDSYWTQGEKEKATEYYLLFLEAGKRKPAPALIKEVEVKIGGNQPAEHIRNAESLFFATKYGEALAEFDNVLKSDKALPRQKAHARMRRGDICVEQDRFDIARQEYLKVLGMEDVSEQEKAKACILMGDSYSIEKKYKEARSEYAKVLGMTGVSRLQKIDAQEKIAEMYRAELNYSQAKAEYGKMLAMEGLTPVRREEIKQRILTIYR